MTVAKNFDHGENSSKDFAELAHNLNELRDLWIQIGLALRDFQFEKDQSSHELVFRQSQILIDNAMQRDAPGS